MPDFQFDDFLIGTSNKIDELKLLLKIAKHGFTICTYSDQKTFNYWNNHLKEFGRKNEILIKEKKYEGREEDLIEYLEQEKNNFYEKLKDTLHKISTNYQTLAFSVSGLERKFKLNDIGRINVLRDYFLTFDHFIVIWLPVSYLKDISLKTPDLWRIRTKVFQFDKSDRHNELGISVMNSNLNAAQEYFEKAISRNPNNPQTWNNKALCLLKLKNFEESLSCFEEAIKLVPSSVQFLNNYAVNLCLLKKHNKSLLYFEKGIKIDRSDPKILVNYGVALIKLHSFNKAISCFNKILAIEPENRFALFYLSQVYLKTSRLHKAFELLESILKKTPSYVNAIIALGIVETKLEKFDSAYDVFQNALTLDPKNVEARVNRGILFSKTKKLEQALEDFEYVLEINEDHLEAIKEKKKIIKKLKR